MVSRSREVKIYFSGDPDSAVRAFRQVDDSASRSERNLSGFSSRVGSTFASMGRNIATGVATGVAAAGAAVGGFLVYSAREAAEAQQIGAQTTAVLKSTGGAAKVTAAEIANLAETMSMKTGIDDEAIQSAQNLLLTFTNIRNEAGRGNDVFDQTTKIALDMSVALGTDARSSAMQLGKALNDPAEGLSKLTRSGVTFTEQQEEQIKAMQAAGDTAGAQRIMLAELRREFGGSAAAAGDTFAGSLERLKVSFGNVAENIGNRLMPHIQRFADWIQDHMPQIERTAVDAFKGIVKWVRNDLVPAFQSIKGWWDRNGSDIVSGVKSTAKFTVEFIGWIVDGVQGLIRNWHNLRDDMRIIQLRILGFTADWADKTLRFVRATTGWIPGYKGVWDNAISLVQAAREGVNSEIAKITEQKTVRLQMEKADFLNSLTDARTKLLSLVQSKWNVPLNVVAANVGDGPGFGAVGGSAMGRAQAAAQGLGVSMSSGYRTPAENASVGGSPTSFHMDRSNPASDWVGSTAALDAFHARLVAMGGWRELLWRVPNHAPGDNPHVHVAHNGELINDGSPGWRPGLRADERLRVVQTGERVLSRPEARGTATATIDEDRLARAIVAAQQRAGTPRPQVVEVKQCFHTDVDPLHAMREAVRQFAL